MTVTVTGSLNLAGWLSEGQAGPDLVLDGLAMTTLQILNDQTREILY